MEGRTSESAGAPKYDLLDKGLITMMQSYKFYDDSAF